MIKKNIMLRRFIILFTSLFFSLSSSADPVTEIRIAAGIVSGAYYPAALQLCSFITKHSPITDCKVIASSGSINNLNLLGTEKVDFAFVQSDVALDALNATGISSNQKPYSELRMVMSFFPEYFTMIVRDGSGILDFSELSGKKIGVNLRGSGAKSGMLTLFKYFAFEKDPQLINVTDTQLAGRLCDNEVDAVVLFTGHPSGIASQISSSCKVSFVSIASLKLDRLLKENPVYESNTIPANIYPGIAKSAATFSTRAIFVTNDGTSVDKVQLLTNTIRANFDEFKNLYPVFKQMNLNDLFKTGVIPLYKSL